MFVFNQDVEFENLGGGITRKVLAHNGKMMAVEVHFNKDSIGAMHHHYHEQLTYVLSGKFRFTIDRETHDVSAGDTLYKSPNVEHGCICLEEGVLLDTFTPMRDDFLS